MVKPFKYSIFCNKTNRIISETNILPLLHHLQTYEPSTIEGIKILTQTKTCYIDIRYEAKLRLYNYLTYTKKGLPIPTYNPYKNTLVGKTIPILEKN